MVDFIKFKIDCLICLLEETREATEGMFKNPNWLENNIQNKYSNFSNGELFIEDAEIIKRDYTIPISLAYFYNLPGSRYIDRLHNTYEK